MLGACTVGGDSGGSSIGVTIEPSDVTVVAGTAQPFVATVTGASNPRVDWSLEEGSLAGAISSTGVYRASSRTGTYRVLGASRADGPARGLATVTVVAPPEISVAITSPATPTVTLPPSGTVAFLAAVKGTGNRNVVWTIDTGRAIPGGSISVDGVYVAPPLETIRPYLGAGGSATVIVRARSVVDPTKSATRPVVIQEVSDVVTLSPPQVVVALGGRVTLALSPPPSSSTIWMVNGVVGGNAAVGRVSAYGGYAAPWAIPSAEAVIVHNSVATNTVAVTVVSRFLPSETVPVHACMLGCPWARPAAIVAADFNGDGLSDLATANPASGTISVLMSADASHFAAPYRVPVGSAETSQPRMLVAGLLDGDGTVDLAVADADFTDRAVRARLGAGDGTFYGELASELPGGVEPLTMAVGTLDGDSIPDLVMVDPLSGVLHLFRGLGNGGFRIGAAIADAARMPRPTAVAVADFDRSGRDDLAVADGGNTVSIWLTAADGTLRYAQTIVFRPGSIPVSMSAVDLNSDSALDLLVATTGTWSGVSVALNSSASQDAVFSSPLPSVAAGPGLSAMGSADFNRDGYWDTVVVDQTEDTVTTYFNDGAGVLVRSETYRVGVTPEAVAIGDFNGDGWPDLAVVNRDEDSISMLLNRGGPSGA